MIIRIPYSIDLIELPHADGIKVMQALEKAGFYQMRYLKNEPNQVAHGVPETPTWQQGTLGSLGHRVFFDAKEFEEAKALAEDEDSKEAEKDG